MEPLHVILNRLIERDGRCNADLARALVVDAAQITRWRAGTSAPSSRRMLRSLLTLLHATLDEAEAADSAWLARLDSKQATDTTDPRVVRT